ncbi:hypothetical protein D3C72_2266720 [compost metagenome]
MGLRCSQLTGVIIEKSRLSSATSSTEDWMKSVAFVGSTPAASQSSSIRRVSCRMLAVSLYLVVSACQSAAKK